MPDQTPHLGLPYLQPAQAQKHVTHNEAIRLLDRLVQLTVRDRDRTEPPGTAEEGDRHIVAPGATGAWAGEAGRIAIYETAAWQFVAARPGWRAHVLAEGRGVVFDGTGWEGETGAATLAADSLGLNASADASNRLAVSAAATLLSHDGAGHQLKLNKAAPGETASLLFQTAWGGRAEMGTAGSDDFAIKVSADGVAWSTALSLEAATGLPDLAAGATAGGAALYTRDTLVGPVSQSGGVPGGAAIESGSNANGSYTRFADGTQICHHTLQTSVASGVSWFFPAAMVLGSTQVQATAAAAVPSIVAVQALGLNGVVVNGWNTAGARTALTTYVMATGRWF